MSDAESAPRLTALRTGGATHHLLQAIGAVIGLVVATVHWSGFLLGGALVGVLAWNLRRALLAGLAVGVLGWVAFAGWLLLTGTLGGYLAAGQPLAVSLVIAPVLSAVGGLVRGVL